MAMNVSSKPENFWRRVTRGTSDACWPFVGCRDKTYGYGMIQWDGKVRLAHRVAFQLSSGSRLDDARRLQPDSIVVLHTCDTPACCNPQHLRLGTQGDNVRDASQKRRLRFGTANPMGKVTEADAAAIRARCASGMSQRAVAKEFDISYATVWKICTNRRHL